MTDEVILEDLVYQISYLTSVIEENEKIIDELAEKADKWETDYWELRDEYDNLQDDYNELRRDVMGI